MISVHSTLLAAPKQSADLGLPVQASFPKSPQHLRVLSWPLCPRLLRLQESSLEGSTLLEVPWDTPGRAQHSARTVAWLCGLFTPSPDSEQRQ